MLSEREILERLAQYLAGAGSPNDFANWLSKQSVSITYDSKVAFNIAGDILNRLDVYFDGVIDEAMLRSELKMLRVFYLLSPTEVQERTIHFLFEGDPLQSPPISPEIKPSVSSAVEVGVAAFA